MELGTLSISLAVKDIEASRSFYEKFGFKAFAGNPAQNWLILKNGDHVIGGQPKQTGSGRKAALEDLEELDVLQLPRSRCGRAPRAWAQGCGHWVAKATRGRIAAFPRTQLSAPGTAHAAGLSAPATTTLRIRWAATVEALAENEVD